MGRKILKLFLSCGRRDFLEFLPIESKIQRYFYVLWGAIFGIFHPKSRSEDTLRFTEYDFWKSSSRTN